MGPWRHDRKSSSHTMCGHTPRDDQAQSTYKPIHPARNTPVQLFQWQLMILLWSARLLGRETSPRRQTQGVPCNVTKTAARAQLRCTNIF